VSLEFFLGRLASAVAVGSAMAPPDEICLNTSLAFSVQWPKTIFTRRKIVDDVFFRYMIQSDSSLSGTAATMDNLV